MLYESDEANREMNMRIIISIFTLSLLALSGCGSADPTPEANGAASAGEINASVTQAQNTAVNAQMVAEGAPNTPAERQEAAKNVLGDASAAGVAVPDNAAR